MFNIIQEMYGVYVYFRGEGLWCTNCTKSLKESKYDPGMERSSADTKLKLQICLLGVSRDVSVLVSHVDPSANVSWAAVVVLLAYLPIVSISCSSGGPDPGLLETCPAS